MEQEKTARLGLPLLVSGQAGKEVMHNEALALVDLLLGVGVEAMGVDMPPADPIPGRAWIVGSAPTGEWAGRAGAIAGWTGGGWRFVAPVDGMSVWVLGDALPARFAGGNWTKGEVRATRVMVEGVAVLGARGDAIAAPTGGAVVDAEARATLGQILGALRAHGLIAT